MANGNKLPEAFTKIMENMKEACLANNALEVIALAKQIVEFDKIGALSAKLSQKNQPKRTEWVCDVCEEINYSYGRRCKSCNETSSSNNVTSSKQSTNKKPMQWTCPVCAEVNDQQRDSCTLCEESKNGSILSSKTKINDGGVDETHAKPNHPKTPITQNQLKPLKKPQDDCNSNVKNQLKPLKKPQDDCNSNVKNLQKYFDKPQDCNPNIKANNQVGKFTTTAGTSTVATNSVPRAATTPVAVVSATPVAVATSVGDTNRNVSATAAPTKAIAVTHDENVWTCPKCTYINPVERPGCEICSASSPRNNLLPLVKEM